MKDSLEIDRISSAGVDVPQVSQTSVLLKVDDTIPKPLSCHPVYTICKGLGALGFRAIYLCGAADYYEALENIMQESNFEQYPGVWLTEQMAHTSPDADIIVDMTNNIISDSFCAQLSFARQRPCLYLMWGEMWTAISPLPITKTDLGRLSKPSACKGQSFAPISRITSGLALQEILMLAGNVDLVAPMEDMVVYNASAGDRTTGLVETTWAANAVENVVLEVVGAGGVGVHLIESLVPVLGSGCELRIFDPDKVGIENIPLQCPYTIDDVDRPKAIAIVDKLQQIQRDVKIRPMVTVYEDRSIGLSKPSLRIICADNWQVRQYANNLSIHDKVALVDAGSSPIAAQQRTYYPGLTACLSHRIHNLAQKAASEEQPASCTESHALTLPGTNMIIAGILACEVLKALYPENFGLPSRGAITYDARMPQRFGILDILPPCEHDNKIDTKIR
jgi:molybdopterin/thiamine biosynthesis adenylyltransferase